MDHFENPNPTDPNGGMTKRAIPKDYPYDPKSVKPLARTLWATSVALGHALTAYRQFSRIKSASVSPDGKLGGMGYIQGVDKIRGVLHQACEFLSQVADTLDDEIKAPHWKPRMSQLDEEEQSDIDTLLEDAQRIMDDPGDAAQDDLEDLEEGMQKHASTIPTQNLGGPRVDNRDPGSGKGPGGSYNEDEWGDDSWPLGPREAIASSGLPSGAGTPTEAYDFGLGWGARGQGVQVGPPSSQAEGYWGIEDSGSLLPQDRVRKPATSDLSVDPQSGLEPASSSLPGDPPDFSVYDRDLPNTSQSYRSQNQPYQRRPSSPAEYSESKKSHHTPFKAPKALWTILLISSAKKPLQGLWTILGSLWTPKSTPKQRLCPDKTWILFPIWPPCGRMKISRPLPIFCLTVLISPRYCLTLLILLAGRPLWFGSPD